jgi:hypothetical protein
MAGVRRLAVLTGFGVTLSGEAKDRMTTPRATLESVDTRSCLPTLPIPNRPPFAIRPERTPDGTLRLRVQQLPDAQPPPPVEASMEGDTLHLVVAPKDLPAGTTFCDVVIRITGAPASATAISVEQRDPGTGKVRVLGTSHLGHP